MWISCNDAINRYDGKTVKVYNSDNYFIDCPNLQQGYGFVEDNNGNIYIGSVRGLYIYHRNQDRFSLQKNFQNNTDAIAMPFAFKDGKIWCFNKQFQISTFDVKTKKVAYVAQLKLAPLKSVHIYELNGNVFYFHYPFMDNSGNFWFIGDAEIVKFDPENNKSFFPLKEYVQKNKPEFFSSSYNTFSNTLFCGLKNGFVEYEISSGKVSETKSIDNQVLGSIQGLASNKDFLVFISNSKIYFLDKATKKSKIAQIYGKEKLNWTYNFSFDKSNRLWLCDDGKGQLIFDFHPKLINKLPNENSLIDYFSNTGVGRFAELPNHKIIIPIAYKNKNNFLVFDKLKNKISAMPSSFPPESSFYGCATDNYRKGIWFFVEYNKEGNPASRMFFFNANIKIKSIFERKIFNEFGHQQDLAVFPNGKILCAFTKGLYWFQPETNSFKKISVLNQSNLFKINILDNNHIAISYLNRDMLLFEIKSDGNFKLIKKLLPGIQSFYLQYDLTRNYYWIGTNQGVYLLDSNFKTLKTFSVNNGLSGTYIYGLLLDDKGNLYCSHQRGLSCIKANSFLITNFDKNDGIQDWDFNNRAFYKSSDGTLFFGGVSGFNYFKPPLKPYSYYNPEVYVDEILVNNKHYAPTINANRIAKIELDYQENNISIKAVVKDLANANVRQLIYRIKEIDKKWKFLPNGSKIDFNNLAPNNYTLQLGTYDKYTNKEFFQKTLIISIATPFYKTIWFWSLIVFALTGIVFWFYNKRNLNRQKYIFQQKLALEQQRNKITADLHDDIGSALSSLQINSAVANLLIHKNIDETQRVLVKIENQSKNLADKIGDIIWSMKPGKDEFMSMSSRIKTFVNEILGSTDILYEINIDSNIDTKVTEITIRKNIILLTKEAINNAVKYSKATQININLKLDENIIKLEIMDNGTGFDASKISGNGLNNMRKRTEELNGIFTITSKPEDGTIIMASFPLVP